MTPETAVALSEAGWIVGSNTEHQSWMRWPLGALPATVLGVPVFDYQWSDGDIVKEQALEDSGYTLIFKSLWRRQIQP
jgi:hypothetical protein